MTTIIPNAVSLTTHHLHMCFRETDTVLSSGTAFVYARSDQHYLITNWHNVSGRNPLTGQCLSETLALPDMITTMFREAHNPGACRREQVEIYRDSRMAEPLWYEHPIHKSSVDVVAIPLPQEFVTKYRLFAINAISFDCGFKEEVADEAFVVGYPFFEMTYLQLPIWKRASIASEPDVDIDQLPKMFIDTATRPGLSGSPVVMRRIGIHGMKDGKVAGTELIGEIRNLIGVYSGRVGDDEFKAQLGIVWKARVIDEIIDGMQLGTAPTAI